MATLKREEIDKAQDLPSEVVAVPEWNGAVIVRGLIGSDRDLFLRETLKQEGDKRTVEFENLTARLVARCLVDEQGQRLYPDAEVGQLGAKSGAVLARLFEVAQRLSGLDKEAVSQAEKN